MSMTTYTVYSFASGILYGRDLSATEAADIILCHDGYEYEIKKEGHHFKLLVSRGSRNTFTGLCGFTTAYINGRQASSSKQDENDAWDDIAAQVLKAGWKGSPVAMTDADYDAMNAKFAAEEESE